MSEKCAYAIFLYKRCKRQRKNCKIHKRILSECLEGKITFSGCEYKPPVKITK